MRISGHHIMRPKRTILTAIECTKATMHFATVLGNVRRIFTRYNASGLRAVAQSGRIMIARLLRLLLQQSIGLRVPVAPIAAHIVVVVVLHLPNPTQSITLLLTIFTQLYILLPLPFMRTLLLLPCVPYFFFKIITCDASARHSLFTPNAK